MTPRSRVFLWPLLLCCCCCRCCGAAAPGDTQALCGNNCTTGAAPTTTTDTTSITVHSPTNCSFSTGGKNSTNGSISGLSPGTVHHVHFHCFNCCKLETTRPEKVQIVSVTEITTSSVYLNWTKPEGMNSFYRVKWTNGSNIQNESVTETSFNVTNLTPGEKYSFTVQSVAADNKTESEKTENSSYTRPEKVQIVSVTEITTSSVYLNWTKPEGMNSFYRVKWTNGSNIQNESVTETNINITNLTPGEKYSFTVQSVAADNKTESEKTENSSYTRPEKVQIVSVTEITTSSVYLNWTKPEGMNSFYRVKWTNGSYNGNESVTETSFNVTNLTPGEKYSFTVQSVAADNKTESEKTENSSYTRPEKVQIVSVTEITTSSVYLNWTKPEGMNSFYRVKWTNGSNIQNESVTETSFNVTNLTPGEKYSFTVQSVAADNKTESEKTENSSYTRPEKVLIISVTEITTSSVYLNCHGHVNGPEKVQIVSVTEITTSSVYLNWTKPEGMNSFYRVKWTNGSNIPNESVTETSFNVTNLTPGEKYSFTVQSVAADNKTESEKTENSSYTRPEKVQIISVTEITTSSVYLNWTKPEGMNSFYRVKWTNGSNIQNESVTETNINITNLTPGEKYSFTVQSVAADNKTESEKTENSSYTRPEKVQIVYVTEITTSSVYLNWTKPEGMNSFYRVKWTNGSYNGNESVTETNINITNLTPGEKYSFTVQSVAADNKTESEKTENSSYTKPSRPENVTVAQRGTDHLGFSWTLFGGKSHFVVNISNDQLSYLDSRRTTADSADFTGLLPGRIFNVTVTAVAGDLETPSGVFPFATVPTPPGAVSVADRSNCSIWPTWGGPENMAGAPDIRFNITYQQEDEETRWKDTKDNFTELFSLLSGTQYSVYITTIGPRGFSSTPVNISSFTLPNPVTNLNATADSATSVTVRWSQPLGVRSYYQYVVDVFNESAALVNSRTVSDNRTEVSELEPGHEYRFTVMTLAAPGSSSVVAKAFSYTIPEAVSFINVTGGTTNLSVSWQAVSGRVSSYAVRLYRGGTLQNGTDVSNKTISAQITGLKPGVDYCVVLVTNSGPHAVESSAVCNATFPNPPGPIAVQSQTVASINFTWAFPLDMDPDGCSFIVTTVNGSFPSRDSWYLLGDLRSGSLYNISVVTVGVRKYESTEEMAWNYTRPYPVTRLTAANITTDTVVLEWDQPEAKSHYSYFVRVFDESGDSSNMTVFSQNAAIDRLQSGSNVSLAVTTRTADHTEAEPVTVSYFTRPHPVRQLDAETLNTTTIRLKWTEPLQHKEYYLYWVEVTGCSYQNKSLQEETVDISELDPGSNCSFCVSVRAGGVSGERICTSEYTKPETVQLTVTAESNHFVRVSWTKPVGNVEKYQVNLTRSSRDSTGSMEPRSIELDGNRTDYRFEDLSPGRLYSVVVTAYSGPFSASSELKENATFPNPPGAITVLSKTNESIHLTWTEAPLMEGATFFYRLTLSHSPDGNVTAIETKNITATFDSLPSGTSFLISVSTVGIWNFESPKVYQSVTTRPLSVQSLTAAAGDALVRVDWVKPDDYKDGYRYNLTWEGPDGASGSRVIVNDTEYTIEDLVPGSRYNVSVVTETADGTQAEPRRSSNCTRASPVKNLTCGGLNEDDAQIILSWLEPNGQNSGFRVWVNDTEIQNTSACCRHNVSNLLHNTEYNITVETLSCGQASAPETRLCKTGITNPSIPPNYETKVKTAVLEHNKFTIAIDLSLFDQANGPITHVGVLVTKSVSGPCSDCRKYLSKTYDDFKYGTAPVYLATVIELRQRTQQLSVQVGNGALWEGYSNGALEPQTKYRYAVVIFTRLIVRNELVDDAKSLVSFTGLSFTATLPINPAVVGVAVGSTMGIFCVLFIILVGFTIFWKRMSQKESPEIQIHSLRTKVSSPVRVEEYETYFRKQRADSNCGFAEEFEDMKPVGTAQAKIQALSMDNKSKNRYTNVLPYDSSRVKLSIIRGSPSDDYINANYIPGYNSRKEFIASQGPLPATVNDFWRMIWEKNVQTVVMLTRCNEQGRIKCEQYWSPGMKHYGNITVTTDSEIPLEDWTIRDFTIKNLKTAETRSVRHFHFTAWPDHGVPETTELLIGFRHLVREHMNQYSRHSPTVVHCSAGVGRTGTFIAIDHLIFQIERENIVDVYGVVHELRMHRALMVQTEDQYVFLNQCALDIIRSRTGTNVDLIYQNAAALSIYENLEPHRAFSQNSNHKT